MTARLRALALAIPFVLAACGGGGGGPGSGNGGVSPGGPQGVVITETNAKPVAASALEATQSSSATGSAGTLPIGVQVGTAGSASASVRLIADAARFAARTFSPAALPAGVAVSETDNCSFGGSVTITGQVASSSGLGAGDSLSISFNNCSEFSGTVMNGQLTMSVTSGALTALPFHVVATVSAVNLSVSSGGTTQVANGTVTLDWTATSATSETLTATSTSMSTRKTVSGVTHTTTLRNFTQTQSINGTTVTGSLSATVETDSPRLGGTAVSYTVTTPTPVVWNESTQAVTAGVIKVVGANNSQLLATVNAGGTVTIQLDANGDGVFEKTITSTTAELAGLV